MTDFIKPKGYIIKLSFNMLIALCDIHLGYDEDDSPCRHARTIEALRKRKLIKGPDKRLSLSPKGEATMDAALYEMFVLRVDRSYATGKAHTERVKRTNTKHRVAA